MWRDKREVRGEERGRAKKRERGPGLPAGQLVGSGFHPPGEKTGKGNNR